MFIIYDLIFLLLAIFYIPLYLFKGKFHSDFFKRFGIMPVNLNLNKPIWIHAVSVGEAMAVRSLIEELRKTYPAKQFVFSTVTSTGNKIVKGIAKENDFVTYLPLDFSFIVKRVLKRINPEFFIIVETEIWPNLISQLYKRGIPVVIVNGRISDRAFKGYKRIRLFIRPILRKIALFCVQSSGDEEKFITLGVNREKVKITGNLKFDSVPPKPDESQLNECRNILMLKPSEKLIVCGSTHPGEEEIILRIYRELLSEFANLRILIAPRHPERSKDVYKIAARFGFNVSFYSAPAAECVNCPAPVFILDVIGQLNNFYALSDIVFMGGSLVKKGGHNILEPASFAKPILFGPYMFNFSDISDLFLRNQAAIQVDTPEQFKDKIIKLLINDQEDKRLGQKAEKLILGNLGATANSLELIKHCFDKGGG